MNPGLRARLAIAMFICGGLVFAVLLGAITDLGAPRVFGCALIAALILAGLSLLAARWLLAPARRMAGEALAYSWETGRPRLTVHDPDDELGKLADAFNNVFIRLEESLDESRRFTSDASHELRTPLTAMRSLGEVTLSSKSGDTAALRDCVGAMLEEAAHMARLIDDLLLLSRGHGEPAPDLIPVDITALVRETASMMHILAEEKHQTLSVRAGESVLAMADPAMLRLALVNLLQNAIRHSPPGSNVRAVVRASGLAISIDISDDGPGIGHEHHARIFERFYRTDQSRARESGGSGLGLAITKWAVHRCGGEIGLRSSPGNGSTFFICLKPAS